MFKFNVIKFFKKEKITKNTRICFDCDNHYTPYKNELPFLYCPYCGKQTYGFDNESLERFDKNYFDILKNDLKENQEDLELIDKFIYLLEELKSEINKSDEEELEIPSI